MSTRSFMQKALQKIFVPVLRERGFTGKFPHFRRIGADGIDLLSFTFDQYGGGFVMEVAVCPPEGYSSPWLGLIPPDKITALSVEPLRHRLGKVGASGYDLWFTYPTALPSAPHQLERFDETAREALEYLDLQAESWWRGARAKLGKV